MGRWYKSWRWLLERVLGRVASLAFLAAVAIAIIEVFRRYVLGRSWLWQQDAVVMLTLSSAFLYFAIAQLQRRHIAMLVVQNVLARGGRGANLLRRVLEFASLCAFLGITLILCYWAIHEARTLHQFGTRSSSLLIPMWPFIAALAAGFVLVAITLVLQIVRSALGKDDGVFTELDEVTEVLELGVPPAETGERSTQTRGGGAGAPKGPASR